ncbi:alanyl-tRNA editing protein [Pantoea latae]|uniref:Threonyl/alanyl tRNA synthetase SAD domain-containing protein n=1 Tax=Pantoea latae TaxID=1964541 RepID=A0A1V9DAB4_9GAMM|nr:hypothetical protein [Pantoea latae]OQP30773.1 hypothetical protein B2J69_21320 [Pantoea latae]
MTERTYFVSDALEMESWVTGCTSIGEDRFHVTLSATLFHPQGGGQPSDRGTINGVAMLQAVQEGDALIHITDRPLIVGPAHLQVDAALRARHTRYHSAGHIIGLAGEKYGWLGVKGNHKPGEGRIVFEAAGSVFPVTIESLRADAAALVQRGDSRVIREAEGKRMVSWGDLKPYACGGTHVQNTREIGAIRILKVKEKKGQLSVQYELEE